MARRLPRPAILALAFVITASAMATCNLPQPQLPHFKVDGGYWAAARSQQFAGGALPPGAAYSGHNGAATSGLPSAAAAVPPMTSDL